MECLGNENNISECSRNGMGNSHCLHKEDIGVKCLNGEICSSHTCIILYAYFTDELKPLDHFNAVCSILKSFSPL